MTTVFVSYAGENAVIAEEVYNYLKERKFHPYLAERVTEPARELKEKIKEKIATYDAFILVWSEEAKTSVWVQQELGYALEKLPLIPIMVRGFKPRAMIEGLDCIPYEDKGRMATLDREIRKAIGSFKPVWTRLAADTYVCEEGPHEVETSTLTPIRLDVEKGDLVLGHLEEEYNREFDWYIVKESAWIKSKRDGKRFTPIKSGDNVIADEVRWPVRSAGPWLLLLGLYQKRDPRSVFVRLRKERAVRTVPPVAPVPSGGNVFKWATLKMVGAVVIGNAVCKESSRFYISARGTGRFVVALYKAGRDASVVPDDSTLESNDVRDVFTIAEGGTYSVVIEPRDRVPVVVDLKVNISHPLVTTIKPIAPIKPVFQLHG